MTSNTVFCISALVFWCLGCILALNQGSITEALSSRSLLTLSLGFRKLFSFPQPFGEAADNYSE